LISRFCLKRTYGSTSMPGSRCLIDAYAP
jgi:hypothetical protein